MTTNVVACTSFQDGHVTRSTSLRTCARNVRERDHHPNRLDALLGLSRAASIAADFTICSSTSQPQTGAVVRLDWQARRDSNPQPPVLETGALPIELLAYSSVCVSSCRALTMGHSPSLRLFVRCMPAAPSTILLKLEAIGHFPFILRRVVVPLLTLGAREDDNVAHHTTRQSR